MNPIDKQKYIERYTRRWDQFGYDPRTLGWGKGGRQSIRFAALSAITPNRCGDVLDVGCGFADLYGYLRQIGWQGRYVGVDLVPVLLDEARRRYPDADLRLADIEEEPIPDQFDYVFASGVFNARLQQIPNHVHVASMLKHMFHLGRCGVAADFMSTQVDFQRPEAFHFDPRDAASLAMQLTRRFAIRHDYLPFEYCLYLYKSADVAEDSKYRTCYDKDGNAFP